MAIPEFVAPLIHAARQAKQHAYAPYSNFPVGACLRTEQGTLYAGANTENASIGLSICAEAAALLAMVTHGERVVTDIVVVSDAAGFCPPCGACRQRLIEFAHPRMTVHLVDNQGGYQALSMVELFPFPFDNTLLK